MAALSLAQVTAMCLLTVMGEMPNCRAISVLNAGNLIWVMVINVKFC